MEITKTLVYLDLTQYNLCVTLQTLKAVHLNYVKKNDKYTFYDIIHSNLRHLKLTIILITLMTYSLFIQLCLFCLTEWAEIKVGQYLTGFRLTICFLKAINNFS